MLGVSDPMIPNAYDINWHDMDLLRVEEFVDDDILRWHVDRDISDKCDGTKYEKCIIEFLSVNKYSVDEGSVASPTTILDLDITTVDQGFGLGQTQRMEFGTTAGHRLVCCNGFRIVPYA